MFMLVSAVYNLFVHQLSHAVCASTCVYQFVPGGPFSSVSISTLYLRELMAERHAPYPAHPTPEAANELLLYTLMKYNCIMVCK